MKRQLALLVGALVVVFALVAWPSPVVLGQMLRLERLAWASFPAASADNEGALIWDSTYKGARISDGIDWHFNLQPEEESDYIPIPIGAADGNATHSDATIFDGVAYRTSRPIKFSKITFRVTNVSGGGGTVRVCVYQQPAGASGVANLVGTTATSVTTTGNKVANLSEGVVHLQPGRFFILHAKDPGSPGGVTLRVRTNVAVDLFNQNVPSTAFPVSFTTTISGTACPATFNPINSAGGGEATPSTSDLALIVRFST
jgi:hypothetical protein